MREETTDLVRKYGELVQDFLNRQWSAYVTLENQLLVQDNPENGGHYAILGSVLESELKFSLWVDKTVDGQSLSIWVGFQAERFSTIKNLLNLVNIEPKQIYSYGDIAQSGEVYCYKDEVVNKIWNVQSIENFQSDGFCGLGVYFDTSTFESGYASFIGHIFTRIKSYNSRYYALRSLLTLSKRKSVELSLERIAGLVGPLPKDANTPQFWANTDHHLSRRRNWLEAGYKAYNRRQGRSVRFVTSGEPSEYDKAFDLLERGPVGRPQASTPERITREIEVFQRNHFVVAYVLQRAKGKCECCGEKAPFNRSSNGEPFLEVHHIEWLADGGEDSDKNAVAVCPNCHRFLHYGDISDGVLTKLRTVAGGDQNSVH